MCDGSPEVIALSFLKYDAFKQRSRKLMEGPENCKHLRSIYVSLFPVREHEWKLLIHPLHILQNVSNSDIQAPGIVDEHLRWFAT